jgi:hypothetical protein
MQYTISTDGVPYTADTPEGALSKAALLIWFPHGKIADYRQALKRGEELTIVYGFKSVTITPVQEA